MKTTSVILLFLFCINVYPQKKGAFISTWNSKGSVDSEVPSESYNYFKKGKLYYSVSNDNENIYLSIRVEDSEIQNKILRQGMTVWVNSDGKQAQKTGIRYPLGSQIKGRPGMGNTQEAISSGNPNSLISQANTIGLIGFTSENVSWLPANNTDNFRGSVRYNDEGLLLYWLVMPLARLRTIGKSENDQALYTFAIEPGPLMPGMRTGSQPGSQPPGGSGIPPRAGGGRSGGGGGRPSGGGMPGRGPSGGAPSIQSAEANIILWIKNVELATEK